MAKVKKSKKSKSGKKYKRPNRNAAAGHIESTSSPVNQQTQSKLMQLPQEIRDEIYATVFRSTRFAFGKRAYSRDMGHRIRSANCGTALAILRTCRRVRDEVGVSWLNQVLFQCEDPTSLLRNLTRLPAALLGQIRHVRVLGDVITLTPHDDCYYCTAQILRLLPGLKLDRLTVLGAKEPGLSYETLKMLVRYGDGWKELHYRSHNSKLLGHKLNVDPFDPDDSSDTSDISEDFDPLFNLRLRQPQPTDWQDAIEQRDGKASHPSVVVYRDGGVFPPQAFTDDQDMYNFGKVKDKALMRAEELRKEMLTIVKRGAGVDYVQKKESPYHPIGDIRFDRPGITWDDIKVEMNVMWSCRGYSSDTDEETDGEIVDEYRHVDDYDWPPLHMW
jgi:hypothetical protein